MAISLEQEIIIRLPRPTPKQLEIIRHPAKRKIVRAGRRGGKTVGAAILAVEKFLDRRRVLYAAPTVEQIDRFWTEVVRALYDPIDAKIFTKNETEHVIELPRTEARIRAKTAWNSDTLRGDYAGVLILDEWQLMDEDAWDRVGAPMLLDNNGDACFIYTPPSLHSRSVSKSRDPQHAAKMFRKASEDTTGRWAAFHFTSRDNPHISSIALDEISRDMTALSYRMEIMAEDVDEVPGALWTRAMIDHVSKMPLLKRIVVGLDPSATSEGDEAGIVVAGTDGQEGYVLADESIQGSPLTWAKAAIAAFHKFRANRIVAEANQGGEMVEMVIHQVDPNVPVTLVHASRGKQTRAEPISAQYEKGRVHHVGSFPALEDEMCTWLPGDASPNRLDACFVAGTVVETDKGPCPIEDIKIGDRVLTREGYKKVLASGQTGEKNVLTLMLSYGIILSCTPDHRIYACEKGWTPAWKLKNGDPLLALKSKASLIKGWNIDAIPRVKTRLWPGIFSHSSMGIGQRAFQYCIERYGKIIMDLFPRGSLSIIKMGISEIMRFLTLNASRNWSMATAIGEMTYQVNGRRWIMPENLPLSGMEAKRELSGIRNTVRIYGKGESPTSLSSARNVVNHSNLILAKREIDFAPEPVYPDTMRGKSDITKSGSAPHVVDHSLLRNLKNSPYAPAFVLGKSEGRIKPVYNLEVEGCPEYFANGILVHNCVWALTDLMLKGTVQVF